jgi:hypothetical protein
MSRIRRQYIKEALRVLKKDGVFVFQDLFLWKKVYGETEELLSTIQSWGIREIKLVDTSQQSLIPGAMKLTFYGWANWCHLRQKNNSRPG